MADFNPFGQLMEVRRYKEGLAQKRQDRLRQKRLDYNAIAQQQRANQITDNALARAQSERDRIKQGREYVKNYAGEQPLTAGAIYSQGFPTVAKEFGALGKRGTDSSSPSNVREWEYYNSLPEKDKPRYLAVKRAEKFIDLGGRVVSPTPGQPGAPPAATFQKTLPPKDVPAHIAAVEETKIKIKALATAKTELADMEAGLPGLKDVVKKLSSLGKTATFTKAGQLYDAAARQAGKPTKGSIARADYIATVNNEVLPLLRQTFGAAFTAQEGESLKITLGDPNSTPAEKDAQLNAFIESKTRQIEEKKRRISPPKPITVGKFTVEAE